MSQDRPTPDAPNARPAAVALALAGAVLAAVVRVVPHPPNLTGVGGVALFGGGRLRPWQALALPLALMFVSDLGLWALSGLNPLYSPLHLSRAYVYVCVALYAVIGWAMLREKASLGRVALASLLGSVQFFLLTNFLDWLLQPLHYATIPPAFRYGRDLNGLLACYTAALPFFEGESPLHLSMLAFLGDFRLGVVWLALGDLFASLGLYGAHAVMTRPAATKAEAEPVNA